MTKIKESDLNELCLHINSELIEVIDSVDLDYEYDDLILIKLPNQFKKLYVKATTPTKSSKSKDKIEISLRNLLYCLECFIDAQDYRKAILDLNKILVIFNNYFDLKTKYFERLQKSVELLQKLV